MSERKAKYINPYTDFGFKKLFGEEGSKDLLIDFLNQLLPSHHQIYDLDFRNTENVPDLPYERMAFFDIHCKAITGERFIVEMQKAKVKFFKDRSLFYTTFPIREKAEKGDWDFRLESIYFVAILDFEYGEEEEKRKFYRDVALKDQDVDLFYDKLHFKFLQMPLFNKGEEELDTQFDKWCYFLKHLEDFDHIPAILNQPIFQKAFNKAELANMTVAQRDSYTASLLNYLEFKNTVDTAVEEAIEDTRTEIVERMIEAGYDDQTIEKLTKVPLEIVDKIKKRLGK